MTIKKAIIIFHSVCGNTFLMAQEYQKALQTKGIDAHLFRVEDPNFAKFSTMFEASRQTKDQLEAVPIINDSTKVLDYDLVVMGSPTYFGNVSGPMKMFMDSFSPMYIESKLYGKLFASFATASSNTGGADMCLLSLNNFALHLGMSVLAVPANLKGASQPAYGLAHYAGGDSMNRPEAGTIEAINSYVAGVIR